MEKSTVKCNIFTNVFDKKCIKLITKQKLVEYGFIDNPEDLSKIQNNYKKYVDAVVDAVITSYNVSSKPNLLITSSSFSLTSLTAI